MKHVVETSRNTTQMAVWFFEGPRDMSDIVEPCPAVAALDTVRLGVGKPWDLSQLQYVQAHSQGSTLFNSCVVFVSRVWHEIHENLRRHMPFGSFWKFNMAMDRLWTIDDHCLIIIVYNYIHIYGQLSSIIYIDYIAHIYVGKFTI